MNKKNKKKVIGVSVFLMIALTMEVFAASYKWGEFKPVRAKTRGYSELTLMGYFRVLKSNGPRSNRILSRVRFYKTNYRPIMECKITNASPGNNLKGAYLRCNRQGYNGYFETVWRRLLKNGDLL